jgi:hypothetical protein
MYVYRKNFVFLHECMSASVGNTINRALLRLHDIEAISSDMVLTILDHRVHEQLSSLVTYYSSCYFTPSRRAATEIYWLKERTI